MHQEGQGASASPQRGWAAPVGTLDWHWRIAHRFLLLSCAVPICWENQPSQRSSNIGNSRINLKPLDDTLLNTMVPCNLLWYLHDSKIPFATSPEVSNPAMLQRSVHGQMGCISFVTQMNRLDVFNTKTASGVTCGVYESTSYMWVVKLLSSSQTDTKHTVSIKNDEFFPSGLTTCWKEVPTPPLSFFPSVPPGPPGDLCRFHMLNFALTGVLTRLLKITVWSNSFECLWFGLGRCTFYWSALSTSSIRCQQKWSASVVHCTYVEDFLSYPRTSSCENFHNCGRLILRLNNILVTISDKIINFSSRLSHTPP